LVFVFVFVFVFALVIGHPPEKPKGAAAPFLVKRNNVVAPKGWVWVASSSSKGWPSEREATRS